MPTASPFVKFVSSVEGHLVARYGTATPQSSNVLIGARREVKLDAQGKESGEVGIVWTDEIVALTQGEIDQFAREYEMASRDGALVERSEAEYIAAKKKAAAREKDYAAKVAAEQKKAPTQSPPEKPAQE